ncbi:membrane dipeptidase [Bacilli bacterium PM5-3]|nr:membrane dipeptidase [Bacilli bacterium PM5-3]MDH6604160.1 membrane dipeptidase [Bacilli bacterium PM5-9]
MEYKVIDLHGDLFSHFNGKGLEGEEGIFKKYHLDNFKKGNVYFSVFNIWLDDENKPKRQLAEEIITNGAKEILNNQDIFNQVRNYDDINENGKINFFVGLEGLDYLSSADELYPLYMYGARLAGLTWNHSNKFASSITDANDQGLSDEGRKAIKIMNELGMIVDISHLSDKAALEILDISNAPVIASHSNVRNLSPHHRNVTDEMIKKIAGTGGVIGMNAYPAFVSENPTEKNVEGLIKHIDYIKELVGIDYIAFGFDFMDYLSDDATGSFIEGSPFMEDLKNHSYIMNLVHALENHGYSVAEINKITHENALRVIKTVLK